jgi:hypothetical protein
MLIVFILIHCAHIFTSIPIINSIDKIGGVIFGVIEVLFIVWIFFVLITMLSAFDGGATMMKMIDENPLLSFIYKKDIFLKFVIDIVEIV